VPHSADSVPAYTKWPSFPFEGDLHVKKLADPVDAEPRRKGEDAADCVACNTPDDAYIWVSERWRVRAMERPTGLPMVLILEARSHLDLGDLPNLLAAELGVMTVRLERAVRSLDGVARVHVNRWGDSSAHLHMWFLARPYGQLQLRGTFLSLWDDILPPISESVWRENLALVAAWLAEFGGTALAEPPHIEWQAPSSLTPQSAPAAKAAAAAEAAEPLSVAIAEAAGAAEVADGPAADGAAPGEAEVRPVAKGAPATPAGGGVAPGGEAVAVIAAPAPERGSAPVVVAGSSKPAKA
jgi:diadenosine tetraphosphate (Ap4A) HIT family hydrolase